MKKGSQNTFLQRFKKFVTEEYLFTAKEKILLAVSGGIDSVVMVKLFHDAGFNFGIAHCNFGLRGEESNEDEKFVQQIANELNVQIHTIHFETKKYAEEYKLSTQLAARELRYNWFKNIAQEFDYEFIATAHHQNDFAETILLNLAKGGILQSLNGIPLKNEKIIRPLLFAKRDEIEGFSKINNLKFREDSSNKEDKYQRNLIRNKVIPLLKNINPNLEESIFHSAKSRKKITNWAENQAKMIISENLKFEGETQIISISAIREKCFDEALLFIWLQYFGFTFSQVEDIFTALNTTETKTFFSGTHELSKDRNELVLKPLQNNSKHFPEVLYMEKPGGNYIYGNSIFKLEIISNDEIKNLKDSENAYFDLEKIKFPLQLRTWKTGDYFYPFGFGKRKKLSDFFTDIKLPNREKEDQLVLTESEGKIMWVIGRRTDERFKVDENTKSVLSVSLQK